MVPSKDWPERKEPPEFSNPPKTKSKSTKEKHEYVLQPHVSEGKKIHSFAQGEGPPPDPKYNFLADSEREEPGVENIKETNGNKSHQKQMRGNFKGRRIVGRGGTQKDCKSSRGNCKDDSQPGYDAWRAERNRIDEDRISRQKTAEGNWRREWDNDKVHIVDDITKKSSKPMLGDYVKKDSDRRYHNNNEHVNYTRGTGHRSHRGSTKNFHGNYENRSHNTYDQHRNNSSMSAKVSVSPTSEERTVIATEKSIKVTVNQSNVTKGTVMSVKVNSPNIAGTGRVGPRQRTRVTYSHSDVDVPPSEDEPFFRQKSFEDKAKGTYFNNQKFSNLKKSHSQKKKENETKYRQRKNSEGNSHEFQSYMQRDHQKFIPNKSSHLFKENSKVTKPDSSDIDVLQKRQTQECSTFDKMKVERDIECDTEHNDEQDNKHDTEGSMECDVGHDDEQDNKHDTEGSMECDVEHNDEQDNKHNTEGSMECDVEHDDEQDNKHDTEDSIQCDVQHNDEQNNKHDTEGSTEHNVEQYDELEMKRNVENDSEQNTEQSIECNITAETIRTPPEGIQVSNVKNGETNVKDKLLDEVLLMNEETDETVLIPASSAENSVHVAKDETHNITSDDKNSDPLACKIVEESCKGSNVSSEASISGDNPSNKQLVPKENEESSSDVVEMLKPRLHEINEELLKQTKDDTEQFANDNCDNIEEEITVQRNTEEVIDNSVSSLENKTHSVIEIKDQLICNTHLVQVSNTEKETSNSSNENLRDTHEVNLENIHTVSIVNVDNDVTENTEKTEEPNDKKQEKENERENESLQ
ncbi:uncharacterized protein MAL13P1.304-like [Ceratina calcarata]|uniref:Uncharacterized protein MAL13P1.304-like n=1 Tax=Ceratina calcarata TaxID=156304 RepID=A0AAJ7N4Q8_9HYME|nr:uncharacterized protein MAL13P1.304-like [Ceratina calcarata]